MLSCSAETKIGSPLRENRKNECIDSFFLLPGRADSSITFVFIYLALPINLSVYLDGHVYIPWFHMMAGQVASRVRRRLNWLIPHPGSP